LFLPAARNTLFSVKIQLVLAWIGFIVGVLGALLFGILPYSFFAHTCVFCFGFDFEATRTFLTAVLVAFALMNGSLYGLVDFAIGFIISKARTQSS
jgi:hypothetical protein